MAALKVSPTLLAVGLNSLVALGAAGFLLYTKVIYQRPQITEEAERERLALKQNAAKPETKPGTVVFEPTVVNIEPNPSRPLAADGTPQQIEGKLHYATIGFAMEIHDDSLKEEVEKLRPFIMDVFLSLIGRKGMRELTTVQGRYLLRTQLLDKLNQVMAARLPEGAGEGLITNIYFTQFIVQ